MTNKLWHSLPIVICLFQVTFCCMKRSAVDCHGRDVEEAHPIKVVVIGAGASGVAAASRLSQYPDNIKVTVLEASDRVGGRIKSDEFGEQDVAMGAQWIHGEEGNVAYQMAQELDIIDNGVGKKGLFQINCPVIAN